MTEGEKASAEDGMDEYTPRPITLLDHACENLLHAIVQADVDPRPSDFGAYASDDPRGYMEGVLHEICHAVVLRHGIRAALRRPLHRSVGESAPSFPEYAPKHYRTAVARERAEQKTADANAHEVDTIAAEVCTSLALGMPFDPIDIAVYAVDGGNVVNLGDADDVARLIEQAMKRPEIRRWGRDLGRHLSRLAFGAAR